MATASAAFDNLLLSARGFLPLLLMVCALCAPADAQVAKLNPLLAQLQAGRHGSVTSVIIEHKGKVVVERYFGGTGPATRHDIRSATKSVTSMVVGIAMDRGLLPGVDTQVFRFFPELRASAADRDPNIRLQDLLTMRSGLACDDWVPASIGNEDKMYEQRDWLSFWARLPRSHERGKHFSYCTGNVMAVAALVERTSGMRFDSFADRFLLSPLGIGGAVWAKAPNGATDAGGHLLLTSRDLLAIGRLVLRRGRSGDRQVVSARWVEEATSPQTPVYERRHKYGYFWWVDDLAVGGTGKTVRTSFAWGNGGTYVFVVPEAELAVVITGRNFNSPAGLQPQKWMTTDILPAFLAGP